jgi:hypothetical protein
MRNDTIRFDLWLYPWQRSDNGCYNPLNWVGHCLSCHIHPAILWQMDRASGLEDTAMSRYGRLFHWVFEWDPTTGFSCDRINYGPIDVTASTWIVPNTILEEEPYSEEEDNEL